jgi:hypothetical protein
MCKKRQQLNTGYTKLFLRHIAPVCQIGGKEAGGYTAYSTPARGSNAAQSFPQPEGQLRDIISRRSGISFEL